MMELNAQNAQNLQEQLTYSSDYYLIENEAIGWNNLIFGVLVVFQHILICLVYGFCIEEPFRFIVDRQEFPVNYSPVFSVLCSYFFVLLGKAIHLYAGFGLLFSYNKKLVFSGMGFTLLITLLSIQWYFLMNAFWTKVNIHNQGTSFNPNDKTHPIYLTNRQGPQTLVVSSFGFVERYRATLTQAIRCGLANSIAFSMILGRAGPFQAFFVALVGTIGYELNRYVIESTGFDYGYTFRVFIYAGFMGLVIALFTSYRERGERPTTERHRRYNANIHSSSMALIGVAFIWVFFPTITMDAPAEINTISPSSLYRTPISIIYALAASLLMSISLSMVIYQKVMIRDAIHGIVAGGIVVASAGFYISNPVWAMLMGSVAGIVQCGINYLEYRHAKSEKIITTTSFALFGVQGLIGSIWALIWNYVARNNNASGLYNFDYLPMGAYQLVAGLISMAIGLGIGLIIGLIIYWRLKHERSDNFYDFVYWENDEGIHFAKKKDKPMVIGEMSMRIVEHRGEVKRRYSF